MRTLSIDIETYSSYELSNVGVYKYVEAPDFDIMLIGYSIDDQPVRVVKLAEGEAVPEEFLTALLDTSVKKWAFNANFERVCLSAWLRKVHPDKFTGYGDADDYTRHYLNPDSWYCSMVLCAYHGLPLSLEGAGEVLGIDKQKLREGRELVRYFAKPCKATKANGMRERNLPIHSQDKWNHYVKYNERDVEAERLIQQKLNPSTVSPLLWEEYHIDQRINDRGIGVDGTFVKKALALNNENTEARIAELKSLTNLSNPKSNTQMRRFLASRGIEMEALTKDSIGELLQKVLPKGLREIVEIYAELNKTSVRKYDAILQACCNDGRVRGMLQFYGTHTGRWTSRLVQIQNLPQNHLVDLDLARSYVMNEEREFLYVLYGSIPSLLSELIRTSFIAGEGCKFIVADYAAIEARVLSWLSGEKWRNQVFADNGDIYCASASAMFGVPVEKHGQNKELRQKGKVAELALGYGGGIEALRRMGGIEISRLSDEELLDIRNRWRRANPSIVQLWRSIDRCVIETMTKAVKTQTNGIVFCYEMGGNLSVTLPSGRKLIYPSFKVSKLNKGYELSYYGVDSLTRKWGLIRTYGARLVENIVQGISRDLLAYSMELLKNKKICASVHDELIIQAEAEESVEKICELMATVPEWASGLILRADGYETSYYRKD